MQTPTMEWNTQKKIWQYWKDGQLLEQWEPFLGTWPISGTMRNGLVYELPTPALHTTDSESLSLPTLPTPRAQEPGSTSPGYGDSLNDFASRVTTGYAPKDLMRTPKARDAQAEGYEAGLRRATPQVGTIVKGLVDGDPRVLPTPTTRDYKDGTAPHERDGIVQTDTVARAVINSGEVSGTNWGKFEPAIRRWEEVLGRPAPAPTKPDGKDDSHRLSSEFTEWMMGLDHGWITEAGLKRNEELKACGNGVVPQQAELALRVLLSQLEAFNESE